MNRKSVGVALVILVAAGAGLFFFLGGPYNVMLTRRTTMTAGQTSQTIRAAQDCRKMATIQFGEFILYNNAWGAEIGEPDTVQCISTFPSGEFGWNWSRPAPSNDVPLGPQVLWGRSPFTEDLVLTDKLPAAIASMISLELYLDAYANAEGKYNLSFDIFITVKAIEHAHVLAPTHEIMIWLLWTPGLELPNVEDTINDGHHNYQHRSGNGPHYPWKYIQFTIEKQQVPSRINILAFLHHLMADGERLKYLTSIAFLDEVWFGSGQMRVRTYVFDLKAIPSAQQSTDVPVDSNWQQLHSINPINPLRIFIRFLLPSHM